MADSTASTTALAPSSSNANVASPTAAASPMQPQAGYYPPQYQQMSGPGMPQSGAPQYGAPQYGQPGTPQYGQGPYYPPPQGQGYPQYAQPGYMPPMAGSASGNLGSKPPPSEYTSGIFSCFDDIESCILGWCIPCYLSARVISELKGEQGADMGWCCFGFLPLLCGCWCCLLNEIWTARVQVQERYNIEEDGCTRFVCLCCCGSCQSCQDAREVRARTTAKTTIVTVTTTSPQAPLIATKN